MMRHLLREIGVRSGAVRNHGPTRPVLPGRADVGTANTIGCPRCCRGCRA